MTSQQLSHPSTQRKILHACRNAMAQGIDHVRTAHGDAYLAVRYNSSTHEFTITDKRNCCVWLDLFWAIPTTCNDFERFLFLRVTYEPRS